MINRKGLIFAALASLLVFSGCSETVPPNLLIFHTDEHNFRTLGCYREMMTEDQSFIWGPGVEVETPHIDALARAGAISDRYYAAVPVCSPSRASFMCGLYPINTGVWRNGLPLDDGLVTFAEVLKQQGYSTSYLGKWHLEEIERPGFAPKRKFGFEDNRYMWNGGHWKKMGQREDGTPYVAAIKDGIPSNSLSDADEKSYTTDWLTDRTLEIIERDQDKPFCIMVSFPDPHGPNTVRSPYDTMYSHMEFRNPPTMDVPIEKMPEWHRVGEKNTAYELDQGQMQRIFGMVKCIDDNVGRIMADLKAKGLDRNTIVVFTSDHGDMMGEHKRHNKCMPYEGAAKIPFVISWPEKIPAGKLVHTAYTTVDFSPTILGMMGFSDQIPKTEGMDGSSDFLSSEQVVNSDRIVYISNCGNGTVAAISQDYKLVCSPGVEPWLFDKEGDPDELVNEYLNPEYEEISSTLHAELLRQMKLYKEPFFERDTTRFKKDFY